MLWDDVRTNIFHDVIHLILTETFVYLCAKTTSACYRCRFRRFAKNLCTNVIKSRWIVDFVFRLPFLHCPLHLYKLNHQHTFPDSKNAKCHAIVLRVITIFSVSLIVKRSKLCVCVKPNEMRNKATWNPFILQCVLFKTNCSNGKVKRNV